MIPRVEPEDMLFRKPVSTPDQVRGSLFRDRALRGSIEGCMKKAVGSRAQREPCPAISAEGLADQMLMPGASAADLKFLSAVQQRPVQELQIQNRTGSIYLLI